MDKRKPRRLYWIGERAGAEPEEAEEAEEEGLWEGRKRMTTNRKCTGRGDNDYNDYAPPHPESEAAAASYDSYLAIPFASGSRYAGSPPIPRG